MVWHLGTPNWDLLPSKATLATEWQPRGSSAIESLLLSLSWPNLRGTKRDPCTKVVAEFLLLIPSIITGNNLDHGFNLKTTILALTP